MLDFLSEEKVSKFIIDGIKEYRQKYPAEEALNSRIVRPRYPYYGHEVWEEAASAVLSGANLLLTGPKATGKNVLAENLAYVFGRPVWNISFHINIDASYLIGTDTFDGEKVVFRPGPVYQCARCGGFGVLDEINMAKNEALVVLHEILDYRHTIDIPGYDSIKVNPATRFIATMNYGYAGTRELNEALASRFVIISMPQISMENLERLLLYTFPSLKPKWMEQFALLFEDLRKKVEAAEISQHAVDLRGFLDAIRLMQNGLAPSEALEMGITNKSFDSCERRLIDDVIQSRIPETLESRSLFG